jgi:UDP-3-O-[3-hydroxymyristoyl] N-acetylglucosamine deacetylase / 3-hydroxyacyl-[acyl-carrier-protein] dehydratase
MSVFQTTLENSVTVSGVGLHTGQLVNLTFHPAEADTGIIFRRTDLEGMPTVPADVRHVQSTDRGTTLMLKGVQIITVEHVLAAVAGMQIDNVVVDLDAPEPPIMDGSAADFVAAIEKAGIKTLNKEREYITLKENIRLYDAARDTEIIAMPSDKLEITVMVDFDSAVLRNQFAHMNDLSEFKQEFSRARTFSFLHELRTLLQNGLIKGGDLKNAIVYTEHDISDEDIEVLKGAFKVDELKVTEAGILNNLVLETPNEAARHKLMDVIGDLALIGKPLKAKIFAKRPGHKPNTEFASEIQKLLKVEHGPVYDQNAPPVYDIEQIMSILPHRPPFLLVDRILELTETRVVGVKNVTMNEPFFVGHFPGAPVMPGVLQVEAMAQVGGILVLNTVPDPENYLTYFLKIESVKFKRMVKPGDTIVFDLELTEPIRRGICNMRGKGWVGNKVAVEAVMMAQISKVK